MKALALCSKGIENVAAIEAAEIAGSKAREFEGFIEFDVRSHEDICSFAYLARSIRKACLILDRFTAEDEKDIIKKASALDLACWLKERSFKVDACIEDSDLDAESIKGMIGKAIKDNYHNKVDLESPDIVVFFYKNKDTCYLCIDFSGFDLSKREYRIFSHPKNIKSTIAYAMVRISGYDKKKRLLDPFCLSGTIPIEAALFASGKSVHFFNKDDFLFQRFMQFDFEKIEKFDDDIDVLAYDSQFRHVDASKKNAKIAGINKQISFSRYDIGWLDTKLDKESIDTIVTCLPDITKYSNRSDLIRLYKEFFYQADFILSKKGTIVICTRNPDTVLDSAKDFVQKEKKKVYQGKQEMHIITFAR